MGAPLEDDGESPVGIKSWQKFSRTRASQACGSEDGVPRRTGVRMGEPPRPPPFGCLLNGGEQQLAVQKCRSPHWLLTALASWFLGTRRAGSEARLSLPGEDGAPIGRLAFLRRLQES